MTEEILNEEVEEVKEEVPCEETKAEAPKKEKKDCKKHKKEIEELNAKLAEQEDKYLRVVAEYENFRRRAREIVSVISAKRRRFCRRFAGNIMP